ncbi:MAG: carboxylating nicotinate-nucleotide diphosphorylase [Planctomycetes bacterium]|nr:carboxylating nicotinate-nucleotide diphosphorylase [Planctomycetota bacterium]
MAVTEDIGPGDVTSNSLLGEDVAIRGQFIAKQPGVIAGLPVARYVFARLSRRIRLKALVEDGAKVQAGQVIATIRGPARAILAGERLSLNFLQRLSGIATLTAEFVRRAKGARAQILDTRKTTPGWRYLEKYAVRMGGGTNHRQGLYDMVLLKDNHIRIADAQRHLAGQSWPALGTGIGHAVSRARRHAPAGMTVEVEAQNMQQVQEALDAGADIIMLDNLSPPEMREAVRLIRSASRPSCAVCRPHAHTPIRPHASLADLPLAGRWPPLIEASGGVSLKTVRAVAQTGVDFISVGALTHSAPALDISLELEAN